MRLIHESEAFAKELDAARLAGRTVGLVPTMGALHAGHSSLIARASAERDVAAVTIFVNPLQFGPGEDLASYPRDLDADLATAVAAGAEVVFAPSVEEMYPEPLVTTVRLAGLTETLDGASRPGHFDGVATVVAKLFNLAGPSRAYFGEKDYQQLVIIARMARDLSCPIEVVGCPTVRDPDGLALSSRNSYLDPAQRAAAPVLYRALCAGRDAILHGERDADRVRDLITATSSAEPRAELEYAQVVDAETLRPPSRLAGEVRLLVAARLGRARLIDNIGTHVPESPTDHEVNRCAVA
ncbi:MAG: pantoate--beta-alanine ligase [Acidimicrobiales bacterium]